MGAYEGAAWGDLRIDQAHTRFTHSPAGPSIESGDYLHSTAIGVGHVFFLVVGTAAPVVKPFLDRLEWGDLIRIWPHYSDAIPWPPAKIMGDRAADIAANVLATLPKRYSLLHPLAEFTRTHPGMK